LHIAALSGRIVPSVAQFVELGENLHEKEDAPLTEGDQRRILRV
jgi:hypothetical protein